MHFNASWCLAHIGVVGMHPHQRAVVCKVKRGGDPSGAPGAPAASTFTVTGGFGGSSRTSGCTGAGPDVAPKDTN